MCSCDKHSSTSSETGVAQRQNSLDFRVDDMTCGHCANTIKSAIESNLPGTTVQADPVSKLVSVSGTANRAAIESMIVQAGYTPGQVSASL